MSNQVTPRVFSTKQQFFMDAVALDAAVLTNNKVIEILKDAGFGKFEDGEPAEYLQAVRRWLNDHYYQEFRQEMAAIDEYFEDEQHLKVSMQHLFIKLPYCKRIGDDIIGRLAQWVRAAKESGMIIEIYCPICAKAGRRVQVIRCGDDPATRHLRGMYKRKYAFPWRCPEGGTSHFHQAAWDGPLHAWAAKAQAWEDRLNREAAAEGPLPVPADSVFVQNVQV